jgi:DNA end-binding protein Ku
LKLLLVSCAVAIYPSTNSSSRIRFNTLNRKTGNRVQRQYIDSETGEPVESEDQVKGYAVGKGNYILVEEEELDALKLESTHTIDIENFVPRDEVDERYLDTSYYIAPDDRVAQEAFAVIRDAIRDKGMAGLGRVVMSRRERLLLLEPLDQGLVGTTLHSAAEVRDESAIFDEIPQLSYPKEMRDLAVHIIEGKATHFDPKMFEDRYENALIQLVRSKQEGHKAKSVSSRKPSNVVNLMDALRKSIEAEKPPAKSKAKPTERKKTPASGRASAKGRATAGRSKNMKRAS